LDAAGLQRIDTDSGAVELVTTGSYTDVAVGGAHVYWVRRRLEEPQIFRQPLGGGEEEVVLPDGWDRHHGHVEHVAADGKRVYFTTVDGRVFAMLPEGGEPQLLTSAGPDRTYGDLVAAGEWLYLARSSGNPAGGSERTLTFVRVPKEGGPLEFLAGWKGDQFAFASPFRVHGEFLYFAAELGTDAEPLRNIFRMAVAGGEPEPLLTTDLGTTNLAIDADGVYFDVDWQTPGVWRIPLDLDGPAAHPLHCP
jgi:hypothetical protein